MTIRLLPAIITLALPFASQADAADRRDSRMIAPVPTAQVYHAVAGSEDDAIGPFGGVSTYGDGPSCTLVRSLGGLFTPTVFVRVCRQ